MLKRLVIIGFLLSVRMFAQTMISNVYVQSSTATTATIVWTTSTPSTSQILYGYDIAIHYSNNENYSLVTSHSMTLTVLNASQPYYFAVVSVDGAGHSAQSSTYEFALCGQPQVPVSGTINQFYYSGTYTITWNPPSGSSGTPTACGVPVTTPVTGNLNLSGIFSAQVADSLKVTPGPGTWTVAVADIGNISPVSVTLPLSATTQDISSQLQTAAAATSLVGVIANNNAQTVYPPWLSAAISFPVTILHGGTGATTAAGANLNITGVTQTGTLGTSSQVSTFPGTVAATALTATGNLNANQVLSAGLVEGGSFYTTGTANLGPTVVTGNESVTGALNGTSASFSGTVAAPAIVPTNITPSTSPICANGTGGALTTTGCGGAGAGVTQIIPGTNVTISPSGGTGAVTINSTGAGAGLPTNAVVAWAGDSRFWVSGSNSSAGTAEGSITSGSVSGGVLTAQVGNLSNSTPSYAGTIYKLYGFTGAYAALNGQHVTVTSGSSSQFVATVTGVSDGTTVGTGSFIADSMAFAVFGTKLPSTSSSVFVDVSTGVDTTTDTFIAAYPSKLHPISPAVTGSTGYLVLQLGINDIVTLESASAAYVENNYLTIWAMAHADGWKIVQTSLIPYGTDQGRLSTINEVNLWLRGRSPQDAVTNSQNWDIFDDVAQILPTDTDAAVFMQTGSPNPHHLNDSGNNLLAASVAQGLSSPLSSLYSLNADYNFGLNWALINGGTLTNQGLIVGNNASISPIGNGSIAATSLDGVTVSGTPTPGQSVIASGSTSAAWGYVPCGYNDIPCTDAANSWFGTQTYTTSGPASPAVIEKGSAGAITPVFVQRAFVNTGSPYTLSFTSPVTAGDTLLVFETSSYGTTITDTLGNTFIGVPGCGTSGCYDPFSTAMAYSATGGADTITVTPSSSQTFNVLIAEYRGPLSVSPLDGTPANTDNNFSTGSGGATTVGPITTVANGDLIITATSKANSLGAPSVAGFTARDSTDNLNLYDTIQVSAGNQSAAWNWATGSGRSVGTLFALKEQTLSGQTADLHQYKSAAGALVGAVNAYGQIQLPTASSLPTNTPVDSGVALAADTTCTSLLAVYTGSAWECLPSNPGTVTSVGLTMPGVIFNSTVPGSPVTGSGTLAPTLATQTANTVLAGPATGSAATPTFRALVSADIPNNAASTTGTAANLSGTPALPNGTTATTQTAGDNSTKLATTTYVATAVTNGAYTLPAATSSTLGGVKPDGSTLTNTSGALSVTYGTTIGTAAQGNDSRITGAAQCTAGTTGSDCLTLSSGLVPAANLPTATTIAQGAVRPDGTTITIAGGVISSTGSGVSSLNSLSGAVNLVGGSGISVTPSGSSITIGNTGSTWASITNGAQTGSGTSQLNTLPGNISPRAVGTGAAAVATGTGWTANGFSAGDSNTTGSYWTANGASAGSSNTTGSYWTANGFQAGYSNTTSSSWTANGFYAGYSNTTGSNWTANGYKAGYSNTTGSSWTANGFQAGMYIANGSTPNTTGNNSVYEGANAYPLADGDTNETVIGYAAIGHGSNTTTLGNASITDTWLNGTQHITGTAPTVSAGSIAAYSTNNGGEITGLSAATSVTITFANSGWTNAAFCTATPSTTLATVVYNSAQSKTAVTFTFPALTGNLFYHCDGN